MIDQLYWLPDVGKTAPLVIDHQPLTVHTFDPTFIDRHRYWKKYAPARQSKFSIFFALQEAKKLKQTVSKYKRRDSERSAEIEGLKQEKNVLDLEVKQLRSRISDLTGNLHKAEAEVFCSVCFILPKVDPRIKCFTCGFTRKFWIFFANRWRRVHTYIVLCFRSFYAQPEKCSMTPPFFFQIEKVNNNGRRVLRANDELQMQVAVLQDRLLAYDARDKTQGRAKSEPAKN